MLDFTNYKNLYKLLSEEQKSELERTAVGTVDNIVRSGIELYRTLDEPSLDERQKTEKFLKVSARFWKLFESTWNVYIRIM